MRVMGVGGALCCACAYMAYANFGGAVHQRVHASPHQVYEAFAESFSDAEQGGVTEPRVGESVQYEVKLDEVRDKSIDLRFTLDAKEAGRLHLDFAPDGDDQTMITGTVDADQHLIYDKLGSHAGSIPNSPALAFNLGLKSMLEKAAEKIEKGEPLGRAIDGFEMRHEEYSDSARRAAEYRRQREATEPMVDPDAAARRYLNQRY